MKNIVLQLLFAIVVLLGSSCVKEEFNQDLLSKSLDIEANIASPIGYTTLSLEKLLTQINQPEELVIDQTGFMTLVYHEEVFSATAADIITFPEIRNTLSVTNQTGVDIDLQLAPLPQKFTQTQYMNFSFGSEKGERLDSVWIDFAFLELRINNPNNISGAVKATFPALAKNNVPLTVDFDLATGQKISDLSGFTIVQENGANGNNAFAVELEIEVSAANATIAAGGSFVETEIIISGIEYEAIFGNVGQHNVDTDLQTVVLDFYSEIIEGSFHFEEPEINLYFNNSFGVPVGIGLYNFEADTKYNGDVAIAGTAVPTLMTPFVMNYPTMQQVGQSVADTLTLNPNNANLFDVLEEAPRSVSYGAMATTNPDGNSTANFIHKNSKYDINLELTLPLYGYADMMVMQDTLKFDVKDFYKKDIKEIKKLTFKLFTTNMFPVDVITQVYFADQNYTILDSMFVDTKIVGSGKDSNGDGISEAVVNEPLSVEFDRDKVQKIENAKFILIRGRISTRNASALENVKFYSFYTLDANLGVIVTVEANTTNY